MSAVVMNTLLRGGGVQHSEAIFILCTLIHLQNLVITRCVKSDVFEQRSPNTAMDLVDTNYTSLQYTTVTEKIQNLKQNELKNKTLSK